jgi:DNA replication protein DnaC
LFEDHQNLRERLDEELSVEKASCPRRFECSSSFEDPSWVCECDVKRTAKFRALASGLPREYWSADEMVPEMNVENFEVCRAYASNLPNAFKHGLGLLLTGANGVGKTSSASIILLEQLKRGDLGRYVVWTDFLLSLSRKPKGEEKDLMRIVYLSPLLILDEIGKDLEGMSSARTLLESIVRRRRGAYLPTIMISNLSRKELEDHYGATFASLLAGKFKALPFKAGDYRREGSSTQLISWRQLLEGSDS